MQGRERAEVVIVGGAIVGSATAMFLARRADFRGRVLVIERDLTYRTSSTALSAASIRLQFSTPLNIEISRFGIEVITHLDEWLGVRGQPTPEVGFVEGGYLFLATAAGLPTLEANHAVQRERDVPVALLDPAELRRRFPWLNTEDLAGGSLGLRSEGWFDAYALLQAFRARARSLGVEYRAGEVVAVERDGGRARSVRLADGALIELDWLVNAAGPRAADVAAMAGVELPVHPRKRCVYHFDCRTPVASAPLTIDPGGTYFRPEGPAFIGGSSPGATERDPDTLDLEVDRGPLRGGRVAGARPPGSGLRGDPAPRRMGRPLRGAPARPQRDHRASPRGLEPPVRERLLGTRAAAGAGRWTRPRGVDRDGGLGDPGPHPARVSAGAQRRADPRAERRLIYSSLQVALYHG